MEHTILETNKPVTEVTNTEVAVPEIVAVAVETPVVKAAVKKPATKKAVTKPAVKKATTTKVAAAKEPIKKTAVKKPVTKKAVTAKVVATKAPTKKAAVKKPAVKKVVTKPSVKKPAVKVAAVREPSVNKTSVKKDSVEDFSDKLESFPQSAQQALPGVPSKPAFEVKTINRRAMLTPPAPENDVNANPNRRRSSNFGGFKPEGSPVVMKPDTTRNPVNKSQGYKGNRFRNQNRNISPTPSVMALKEKEELRAEIIQEVSKSLAIMLARMLNATQHGAAKDANRTVDNRHYDRRFLAQEVKTQEVVTPPVAELKEVPQFQLLFPVSRMNPFDRSH